MFHKDNDDDNNTERDKYSLIPVMETTDETLDDIPVR
jgi:hypothetical protein